MWPLIVNFGSFERIWLRHILINTCTCIPNEKCLGHSLIQAKFKTEQPRNMGVFEISYFSTKPYGMTHQLLESSQRDNSNEGHTKGFCWKILLIK